MARSEASRSDVVERESIELKEDSELTDPRRGRSAAGGSGAGWSPFWFLVLEVFGVLGLLIGVIGMP